MRFAKDFEYTISTSDTIDEDYHKLPPMLLQPFVENSIKHGLMHKNGLKTISINFDLDENEEYIVCTIIDNGIGRTKSAEIKANSQVKHNSFSTKSIEERLVLLNENLKLKELITYYDLVEDEIISGTKVIIKIPLL
jgi:sensor histidine kinase YesM